MGPRGPVPVGHGSLGRRMRATVIVGEHVRAEEERLVIEIEGEGETMPPPRDCEDIRVSPLMDLKEVKYANFPLRGQEDFYEKVRALSPNRQQGPLTGFGNWMDSLDDADPDEPRCKVRSKNHPGSIIPVPSTQDHDPAHPV